MYIHAKKKNKASRLRKGQVTHISLVKNPANRRRIKQIKTEESVMFRLSKALGLEPRPPVVVAAFATSAEKAVNIAKSVGVSGDPVEADGVFRVGPEASENCVGVLLSEDAGYVLDRATKGMTTFDPSNLDFDQVVKQSNFFPSLNMGLDAFLQTIINVAQSEDITTKEQFSSTVEAAANALVEYVGSRVDELPEKAFYAELAEIRTQKATPGEPDNAGDTPETAQASQEAAQGDEGGDAGATPAQKSEDAPAPADATPAPSEEAAEPVQKSASGVEEMTAMLHSVMEQHLAPLVGRLEAVEKSSEDSAKRAQAVEKMVKTTVPARTDDSTPPAGDEVMTSRQKRAGGGDVVPFFDTAFETPR